MRTELTDKEESTKTANFLRYCLTLFHFIEDPVASVDDLHCHLLGVKEGSNNKIPVVPSALLGRR